MFSPDSQPGFSVVDPMCGVGTILIEAAQEHKVRAEVRASVCSSDDGKHLKESLLYVHATDFDGFSLIFL